VKLWCRDEGLSGSNGLDTREGLAEALGVVRDGTVGGVVVYRLDRLARDLVLQEQLLAEIRRAGGDLFSASPAEAQFLVDDPDDPSRRFVRQILGAVSEYERSMIALRLRSGRKRKAERGLFAYGAPPLGYTARDKELVPVEDEQRTLERIVRMRTNGASLRKICETLECEGHLTKRGGTRWHPTVVRSVLVRSGLT
jgi:DNA invertase Pin-like site-specific DNA recombinase